MLCCSDLEALEYTMEVETGKNKRTQRALQRANVRVVTGHREACALSTTHLLPRASITSQEENSQLRADLRMLKANSHRTQLVLHLRQVIGKLTVTVRTLSSSCLSLLHKSASEAISVPDASRLWEVLQHEDIDIADAVAAEEHQRAAAATHGYSPTTYASAGAAARAAALNTPITHVRQNETAGSDVVLHAVQQAASSGAKEVEEEEEGLQAQATSPAAPHAPANPPQVTGQVMASPPPTAPCAPGAHLVTPPTNAGTPPTLTVPPLATSPFGSRLSSPAAAAAGDDEGTGSTPVSTGSTPRLELGASAVTPVLRDHKQWLEKQRQAREKRLKEDASGGKAKRTVSFDLQAQTEGEQAQAKTPTTRKPLSQNAARALQVLRAHVKSMVAIKRMKDKVKAKQTMHTASHVRKQFRPLSRNSRARAERFLSRRTSRNSLGSSPATSDTDMPEGYEEDDEAGWGYVSRGHGRVDVVYGTNMFVLSPWRVVFQL